MRSSAIRSRRSGNLWRPAHALSCWTICPVDELRAAVAVARQYPGVRLEASGGLRLETARAVALCGVDYLAVGALTHSSPALDLGLDFTDLGEVAR